MVQHIHGTFEYDVWIPARSQTFNKETREHDIKDYDEYEIMFTNDDNGFKIRNKITNRVLKHCNSKQGDNVVTFSVNNVHTCALVTHVMLISAFPDVAPSETVDHIDNIHTNNNITNLQWMSLSMNCGKVAQFKEKSAPFTVSIPTDEEWRDFSLDDGKTVYKVSNYGRVQRPTGVKTFGTKSRNSKIRTMNIEYLDEHMKKVSKHVGMHRLVWETYNSALLEKQNVYHDLSAPLASDGSFRNWLMDLSIEPFPIPKNAEQVKDGSNIMPMITVNVEKRPRLVAEQPKIPTGFWIQKATDKKGAIVVVEIKRAKKNDKTLYWKSPSGAKMSLSVKIEVAKKFVRWVLDRHQDMAIYVDIEACKEDLDCLDESEKDFYNNFEFREQDDPFNDVDQTQLRKRVTNSKLPLNCGVTVSMLPHYCTYQPASQTRGDKFYIERHPRVMEVLKKKSWGSSGSREKTTLQKYNEMMDFLKGLETD